MSSATGRTGSRAAHRRAPVTGRLRVVGAVIGGAAVVAACGTGVGPAASSAQTGAPVPQPTTDDPSLLAVEAPRQATLDMATASGSAGPATAVGADGAELDVVSADCDVPGVRSGGSSVRAAGRFCLVQVRVVDREGAPSAFDPSRTALVDAQGRTTPPSPEALQLPALAAAAAQVPPMTSLTATLVFDVPADSADGGGAAPEALVLDGASRAPLP